MYFVLMFLYSLKKKKKKGILSIFIRSYELVQKTILKQRIHRILHKITLFRKFKIQIQWTDSVQIYGHSISKLNQELG